MTCRELADFIADYLSNELPAETRQRFEEHLRLCPNCDRYLSMYRTTVELGRRAFEDENAAVPGDVPPELVKAILALKNG